MHKVCVLESGMPGQGERQKNMAAVHCGGGVYILDSKKMGSGVSMWCVDRRCAQEMRTRDAHRRRAQVVQTTGRDTYAHRHAHSCIRDVRRARCKLFVD